MYIYRNLTLGYLHVYKRWFMSVSLFYKATYSFKRYGDLYILPYFNVKI